MRSSCAASNNGILQHSGNTTPILHSIYATSSHTIRRWPKFVRSPNSVGMVPLNEIFATNKFSNLVRENSCGLKLLRKNPLNAKAKVLKFVRV
jgi:hypothetical protein